MKTLILVLLSFSISYAQYDHVSVFHDLEGSSLEAALVADYTPDTVIDFRNVKDTLYKKIHLHNDSVSCVYSGLTKYLDPNEDPSEFLFQGGGNEDINLEHCYPQSKGARRGNPQADMHHLFPSRVPVNTARGSDPFRELPDNQTKRWFYKNLTQGNVPSENLSLYSEDDDNGFEPRDDFKGNVARAYFYFYTIYRQEAEAEDSEFFELQRTTLCDWHEADPVDSLEWVRNYKIAAYQDGKANPFILDCRLARLYCGSFSSACNLVETTESTKSELRLVNTTTTPGSQLQLAGVSFNGQFKYSILSLDGRVFSQAHVPASGIIIAPELSGMFVLVVQNKTQRLLTTKFVTQ